MSALQFTKMHGWGNDFVVLDGPLGLSARQITEMCDRRFGIGADGVLVVTAGDPVKMEYWNADGSEAEMCGNGLRCVARYASDRGMVAEDNFDIETPIGLRRARLVGPDVEVELGHVSVTGHARIDGEQYHLIDVGNPHAVVEVADPALVDVAILGPKVSTNKEFTHGTNVEFVRFEANGLSMRVWERGVGETLACGTGMIAAAFVATKAARMATPMTVTVPGGTGTVDFREGSGWLLGPANYAFEGVWNRPAG